MSVLCVDNISIGYEGTAVASNISFSVEAGEYLCIVGENGAGKSTLLKTLLHIQKPLEGNITYEKEGIGYLPQQSVIQRDFPASVWEIVLSGNLARLGRRPFFSSAEKKNTKINMERMGIWDIRKKSYRNLSGGQQQRVLLARALCASSDILFLDEPVSGLDPRVTVEFYELLKKINNEGMTVIMVSHDINAAIEYADHIFHIGRDYVFYGTTEEYLDSEAAGYMGLRKGRSEESICGI